MITNPCRKLAALTPGEARVPVIEQEILDKHFNTNYASTWYLVRGEVLLDPSGNLRELVPGCGRDLHGRNSTKGPLTRSDIDGSDIAAAVIPLLGDGGVAGVLAVSLGELKGGTPLAHTITAGPLCKATMGGCEARRVPVFRASTPKAGPDGWWAVWSRLTLQDYAQLAPVHRGACNVLFADGSVRQFTDENEDGSVNNGFAAFQQLNTTSEEEMKPEDMASHYSLSDEDAAQ
jgi:prepilin-type processing-associated H-X9-DG protein